MCQRAHPRLQGLKRQLLNLIQFCTSSRGLRKQICWVCDCNGSTQEDGEIRASLDDTAGAERSESGRRRRQRQKGGGAGRGKKGKLERNQLPVYRHGHVSQILSSPSEGKRHPAQSWSPVSHRAAVLFSWVCYSNTL